jgi:predicted regulator of Ras-like GTPase activity (Roadblock/LC7/MglB family)
MNPAEAIAELKELSTQIEAVVLAGRDGRSIASNLATEPASRLAADAATLVSGADEVRRDLGREGLHQVQAATTDGSVFVALDGERMAVATTGSDPTVGLVFYDLKTLLRQTSDDPVDDVVSAAKDEDVEA